MCSEAWETRLQFAMVSLKFHLTSISVCLRLECAFSQAWQLGKADISPHWRSLCGSAPHKSESFRQTNVDMENGNVNGVRKVTCSVRCGKPNLLSPVQDKLAHFVWVVSALQLLVAERNLLLLANQKTGKKKLASSLDFGDEILSSPPESVTTIIF